jgi:hypothetical protein
MFVAFFFFLLHISSPPPILIYESCSSTIAKLQSVHNKRIPRNAAGRPASCSAVPLVPSASSSQSVPEEVRSKLCSEPLVKYPPSFCGLKPSVQVSQGTEK